MSLLHLGTIVLETERLYLRPFTMADTPSFYQGISANALVRRYFLIPQHDSLDQAQQMMKHIIKNYSLDTYHWVIILKEENKMIGLVRLFDVCNQTACAELGYALIPDYWKQGYMQEALKIVINYLFMRVGFQTLIADCMSENKDSIVLLKRIGMTQTHISSKAIHWNNQDHDICHYVLTNDKL